MESINILHLTDIHLGHDFIYDDPKDLAYRIVDDQIAPTNKKIDLILVSGDIFDGRAVANCTNEDELVDSAHELFQTILERINRSQENKLDYRDIIFLPGNHDLKRKDPSDIFSFYRKFLTKIYGDEKQLYSLYEKQYLYRYKIFKEKGIIVIGLNSCKVEKHIPDNTQWIEKLPIPEDNRQLVFKAFSESQIDKWYDYGYIPLEQITDVLDNLRREVINLDSYNIVVSFHHHIHPFPEIYGKTGDISLIKNFEPIIEKLQQLGVKLVLHGHKHIPLIRPVANDKFLKDPAKLLYVIAGGNIGSKSITERYFQIVEIFSKEERNRLANVKRFQFRQEMVEDPVDVILPPRQSEESAKTMSLLDILENYSSSIRRKYDSDIFDSDDIGRQRNVNKIVEGLSNIFTTFKTIKDHLLAVPKDALLIILCCHYRINSNYAINETIKPQSVKEEIRAFLVQFCDLSTEFANELTSYLELPESPQREKIYDYLHDKKRTSAEKRAVAFAVTTSYFTDIYQTLSFYADVLYKQIEHKINIKLDKNTFHKSIPSNHIIIACENERRAIVIQLKSKNPTAHKIAVLFIKNYEIKLAKFEKDFDEIGLKTYYLIPRITKDDHSYELDDYNFEAYIPTLLPLLIGENIYSRKEVFIRELIQNALDAILLREDIHKVNQLTFSLDRDINIHVGKEDISKYANDRKEAVNIIKISDAGIGMNQNLVERYFVHIGRSYYSSEEFRELQDKKQTTYRPISKFGIGFLTSFLVCREIRVLTKHFHDDAEGLNIYIPNHEGCFFINTRPDLEIGTTVVLYENPKFPFEINKIISYVKETILDLALNVNIFNKYSSRSSDVIIQSFSKRRELYLNKKTAPVFFLPLNNAGVKSAIQSDNYEDQFGISYKYIPYYDFIHRKYKGTKSKIIEMNSGIKLSEGSKEAKAIFENEYFDVYINYPPSYIDLDVSREKVKSFKDIGEKGNTFISKGFIKQIDSNFSTNIKEWMELRENVEQISFHDVYRILNFVKGKDQVDLTTHNKSLYFLKGRLNNNETLEFYFTNDYTVLNDKKSNEIVIPYEFDSSELLSQIRKLLSNSKLTDKVSFRDDEEIRNSTFSRIENLIFNYVLTDDHGKKKEGPTDRFNNLVKFVVAEANISPGFEKQRLRYSASIQRRSYRVEYDIDVMLYVLIGSFTQLLYMENDIAKISHKNSFILDLKMIKLLR